MQKKCIWMTWIWYTYSTSIHNKNYKQTGTEGNFLNLIKSTYKKPILNSIYYDRRLNQRRVARWVTTKGFLLSLPLFNTILEVLDVLAKVISWKEGERRSLDLGRSERKGKSRFERQWEGKKGQTWWLRDCDGKEAPKMRPTSLLRWDWDGGVIPDMRPKRRKGRCG